MTAPISNEPTTTRLHHYAGRYYQDSDRFRQIADPFSKTSRFWSLFTQWVCSLATTPPQTANSPPPNGGNCIIRAATRRRYPASQLLMLQNPHRFPCGEQRRGRMARLRCPWAPEGPEGTGELQNAGPGRGAGGRWQGQGGPRDRPLRAAGSRVAISRAGRRPPAHTAARPIKASHAAVGTPAGGPPPTGTSSSPAPQPGPTAPATPVGPQATSTHKKRPPGTGWAYLSRLWESNPRPIHYE